MVTRLAIALCGVLVLAAPVAAAAESAPAELAQLAPLPTPTLTPTIKVIPVPKVEDKDKKPAVADPPEGTKACPKPGVLDCMPKVNQPSAAACADWRWIKDHCPGVQVVW